MKKTLTVKQVVELYKILSGSSYQKLDDDSKINVWKSTRSLKDIASKYSEDVKDAYDKLLPPGFMDRYHKAQKYEQDIKNGIINIKEVKNDDKDFKEYHETLKEFIKCSQLIEKAIKELSEIKVEVDVYPLPEEAFGKFMSSNNWSMEQVLTIGDYIVFKVSDCIVDNN